MFFKSFWCSLHRAHIFFIWICFFLDLLWGTQVCEWWWGQNALNDECKHQMLNDSDVFTIDKELMSE